ncbi:hypothetical protein BDM02DRAFT_3127487 [Thelephora ganbajun]|uniref:Uncharacterized protein n=1 Tax=Thelephora ganbajun TaxID=370292 RepID=A0ACB6ZNE2_THEGA|nr:hypothetical protein BDM02DRAFT_3127487 [Thelephora ganbajun]
MSRKASRQSFDSDDSPECDDRDDDDDERFSTQYSAPAHSSRASSSKPPVSYVDYHSTKYQTGYGDSTISAKPVSRKKSLSSVKDLIRRTSERKGSMKGKEKDLKHEAKQRPIYTELRAFNADSILFGSGEITPKTVRVGRSSTGPSVSSHDWSEPTTYSFRDSVSSSLSQFETPPHTPIDDIIRCSMDRISVVAPVSGVEAMDALVDGMNGFEVDDRYLSNHAWSTRPSKTERAGSHPLYHPPLPLPPPGIKLGGALPRKQGDNSTDDDDDDDDDDDEGYTYDSKGSKPHRSRDTRKFQRPSTSPSTPTSASQFTPPVRQKTADIDFPRVNPTIDEIIHKYSSTKAKSPTPSVSGAIRSHDAAVSSVRTSKPKNQPSTPVKEPDFSPGDASEDTEMISRSSVDSVTAEAMKTARIQQVALNQRRPPLQHARSFANNRASVYSDHTIDLSGRSPRSENGHEPSIYSFSVHSEPTYEFLSLPPSKQSPASQAIVQYLHSKRLTTLLRLTRSPHASLEHPLTVSLSDLGCSTGYPLVVFLGLGCVRHVIGVYDEMAECLGLRLIAIDRWGLGRTQMPHSKSARGIPEWATVVNEVLDQLGIDQCSVMAHSAGSPYALAFANRYPHRVRGDVCLLAPWVGEGAGYKWLKYVPNGLLRTAQAAEWKVQAWMLGKPPTIAYEGIGFDPQQEREQVNDNGQIPIDPTSSTQRLPCQNDISNQHLVSPPADGRPSISSSVFSEYDDLRDFEGRFESQSTVRGHPSRPLEKLRVTTEKAAKRKGSKSFLGKLKGGNSQPPSPTPEKIPPSAPRKLKALRSMGSLRGKGSTSSGRSSTTTKPSAPSPQLPQKLNIDIDTRIEFGIENWGSRTPSPAKRGVDSSPEPPPSSFKRVEGVRSISLGTTNSRSPYAYYPPSPTIPSLPSTPTTDTYTGTSYDASLANALIASSHAESAKGAHNDLLLILNHDRVPWGFTYQDYPHTVAVWYGDKDERIAESAVRWLEQTMGHERCQVKVVKGADHGLMYNTTVVLDVFDKVHEYAKQCKRASPPSLRLGS